MTQPSSPRTNLTRWLHQRGLERNPFEIWNAELDAELPGYFVDVGQFDEVLSLSQPCVIFAGRGCGKTAQRQVLAAYCRPLNPDSDRLAVHYTFEGFEPILVETGHDIARVQEAHHANALLRLGLIALVEEIMARPGGFGSLANPETRNLLLAYLARFAPELLPISPAGSPPPVTTSSSPGLLRGFANLVQQSGLKECVVLVDGLDDFPLTAGDPAQMVAFLEPLLGTLPLVECPGMAFKFFLPQDAETILRSRRWFRPDRVRTFHITWQERDLRALLGQRLTYFSLRQPPYESIGQLCEAELAQVIDEELIRLAGSRPRAALILASLLLEAHCQTPAPPEQIRLASWEQAKERWRSEYKELAGVEPSCSTPAERPLELAPAAPGTASLRVDEDKGLVWLGEREIRQKIKPQDYAVLSYLYRHHSQVCQKSAIAEEAWPEARSSEGISDAAIAASIARLRKVLKSLAPAANYIETIKGRRDDRPASQKARPAGDELLNEGGYRLHPAGFTVDKSAG